MKYAVLLAAATAVVALPAFADTVTIGTVQNYDTGSFTVEPTALQDFEKALGDELCQRSGSTCEWKVLASDELWPALDAGEIDAVMAGVPVDQDVGANIDLTLPFVMLDPYLHIGLPGTEWSIEGALVGHLPDQAVSSYAQTTGATFEQFDDIDTALAAVRAGETLSVFGEREALVPLAEASNGELMVIGNNKEVKIKPGLAMAFHADNIDLRFSFEDQIYEMTQDGSLNALIDTWFGVDAARW